MSTKYNHDDVAKILRDRYQQIYGKAPSQVADRVIDCIDEAFLEEWRKGISLIDQEIQERAIETQRLASQTLAGLQKEIGVAIDTIEKANEMTAISDRRTREALQAYTTIVQMNFDTPQQKLQNIQNASYFIWALYAQGDAANTIFSNYESEKVSDVEQEPSEPAENWKPAKSNYGR